MTGSEETRTITGWQTASKLYRKPPGLGWLLALLLVPLLLGWLGWNGLHKGDSNVAGTSPSVSAPAMTAPAMTGPAMTGPSAPAVSFAPLSIVRSGNSFTLTGDLPDIDAKNGLLSGLRTAFGESVKLTDKLNVKAGAIAPDYAGLGGLFGAAMNIPDFGFDVVDNTVTLTGTAPSAEVKADVEAAAKTTWPNTEIINNIEVTAAPAPTATPAPAPAPAPGGQCANLQAAVDDLLRTPITFVTNGFNLTPGSQQLLGKVADELKACPDARVSVVGHTDNTGNDAINVPLSGSRAKSVADYLISSGEPADHVTSKGVGSAEPIAGNNTAVGRAQNRRVAITVS